jgi:hypothetical protein
MPVAWQTSLWPTAPNDPTAKQGVFDGRRVHEREVRCSTRSHDAFRLWCPHGARRSVPTRQPYLGSGGVSRLNQLALVLVLSMITSGILAEAQPRQLSTGDLIKRTVANELKAANAPGHYMYRMRVRKAHETQLKQIVETSDWLIGRLIQVNGKPLTSKQERKEEERLARLLDDESLRRQERKN